MSDSFWEEPQGAAVFKHAVLRQYAPIFASKTGSAYGGRVTIVDGYAGRGKYKNGKPASAVEIANTAQQLSRNRNVQCWFVEADAATFEQLQESVEAVNLAHPPTLRNKELVDVLPEILSAAVDMPLFVFVDPYGMGIPFNTLVHDVLGRNPRKRPPTEVLVNFIRAGVYRNAGKLHPTSTVPAQLSSAGSIVRRLDEFVGGDWWQPMFEQQIDKAQFAVTVRNEYVRRVLAAAGPGWRCCVTPVSDLPGGKDIYDLLLFTAHEQGPWFFNEAVARARPVFREHHDEPDSFMQAPLFPHDGEWQAAIRANLRHLLVEHGVVRVLDHTEAIYGTTIGNASQRNVSAVVKELVAADEADVVSGKAPHTLVLRRRPSS